MEQIQYDRCLKKIYHYWIGNKTKSGRNKSGTSNQVRKLNVKIGWNLLKIYHSVKNEKNKFR